MKGFIWWKTHCFTVQQTPSNLWHEYFYVFIQSFFERVAAGLGQFWHTNCFFVCLRSVNLCVKHYKHAYKEFWGSLLSLEFLFMFWECVPCHWWDRLHQSWIDNFVMLQVVHRYHELLSCCVWCLAPFQSGRSCLDIVSSVCSCIINQQTWPFCGIMFEKVDLT